jgi:hypothetical protein
MGKDLPSNTRSASSRAHTSMATFFGAMRWGATSWVDAPSCLDRAERSKIPADNKFGVTVKVLDIASGVTCCKYVH